MKGYLVLVCVLVCGYAECAHGPVVTPCRESDTQCLKSSAKELLPILAAGVPEFGIAIMDPMYVDRMSSSEAGLEMEFRNTTVKGLKHCKVLNLTRSYLRTNLDLKCSVNMVGDYTLGGKLIFVPIEGNGGYAIKIRDIVVKIVFNLGEKSVGGELYWTVNSWKYTSEVLKGVHFQFDNLFNGNKEFSEKIHSYANENWRLIFQEVAPPIVKAIVERILKETSKLFDNIPVNQLVIQ